MVLCTSCRSLLSGVLTEWLPDVKLAPRWSDEGGEDDVVEAALEVDDGRRAAATRR